uniref:Uncharacterized protein n=1 Tax=Arundo donax TaxID=35708 RepID=A0A0A8XPR4_ARUDO
MNLQLHIHGKMTSRSNIYMIVFLMQALLKKKYLRTLSIWYNRLLMDIMFAYLHMDKLVLERLSQFMVQIIILVLLQGLRLSCLG